MKQYVFFFCIFFTVSNIYGQNAMHGQTQDGWRMFGEDHYSIAYPQEWELDTSTQMGTLFIVLSPLSSEKDQFRENVNLITEDITGLNLSLEEYLELSQGQIEAMVEEYALQENHKMMQDGRDFYELRYTGKHGDYALTFLQRFWIAHETAFVLTATFETQQYAEYKEIAEEIMSSFVVN